MDRLPLRSARNRFLAVLLTLGLLAAAPAAAALPQDAGSQEQQDQESSTFRPAVEAVSASQNLATTPASVEDLIELEGRIRKVVEKVLPTTVGLIVGPGQGTGVIISPDGYVLTAAHVSGRPGQRVSVIMPDGRRYPGVSMGRNSSLDNGLIKITDPRATSLPHAPLGTSEDLPLGTWTVALGHPGGYQQDRPPVVRVGRILARNDEFLLTDNTLVGGDSGGPLFDLDGRVIGIHSRIAAAVQNNVHVPAERFLADWDELIASREVGGDRLPQWLRDRVQADDGLRFDARDVGDEGARVVQILPNSPGAKSGVRLNDRVVGIDGRAVQNGQDMMIRRMGLRAGEAVTYTVQRGQETLEIEIVPVGTGRSGADGRGGDNNQRTNRAVMGVSLDPYYREPGARLEGVVRGGPAERAGLARGDIIQTIDGRYLRNHNEVSIVLRQHVPGDVLRLGVLRNGENLNIEVTLADAREVDPNR